MTTITIKLSTGKVVELNKEERDELISFLFEASARAFTPLMQPFVPHIGTPLEPINPFLPAPGPGRNDVFCSADDMSTRD